MTEATNEIYRSLDRVRRRWRRLELLKALAASIVEAAGLLAVFMLADWLYRFPGTVRLVLLGLGAAAVAMVLVYHVARALSRPLNDAELALFVEKRNPELQGALLSATEFAPRPDGASGSGGRGSAGSALHNYIVNVLVAEARRRVQMVDIRRSVDLGRLKKYALACLAMVVAFVIAGALFPQFFERQGRRVLIPWLVTPEDVEAEARRGEAFFDPMHPMAPIRFNVMPGSEEVLEGGAVEVVAELSRDPLGLDATLFIRSEKSEWERIPMTSVERLYTHRAAIEDINRPLEYYVGVGNDASAHYKISVRKRLKVVGLEMLTEFPAYLRREAERSLAYSGDVATLKGSKVTLFVKTNQPLAGGSVVMGDGSKRDMTLAESSASITLPIDKDDTYRYVVRNVRGEEVGVDRLFFIQALEDRAPTMEVMEPNTDLTVHPLSEVTCTLSVREDWALDGVRLQMEVIRQGENQVPVRTRETRDFLPKEWVGRVDGAAAQMTLALEDLRPKLAPGDSIFYNFEVVDRKGQKVLSDLFYIGVATPEMFVFYGELDWHAPDVKVPISPLMQFIAAAWRLEQERGTLPKDEFMARCTRLADKMIDPNTGRLVDFIRLGVTGNGKGPILPPSDPRKRISDDHTKAGHDLLKKGEPGQAVVEFKIVWAILKQFFGDASIMLASADVQNPNAVRLEQGESFAQIEQLAKMDMRQMDGELEKQADQQVDWRRQLGRKEMEKVEEARKDIQKLKKDVQDIADQARENKDDAEKRPGEEKPGEEKPGEKKPGEDQKPGEEKPGEKKPGEQKPGDEQAKDDSQKKPGEEKDDGKSLKDKALDAARRAEDVARKLQEALGERKDNEVREGLENLRDAAEELKRAALDFDENKMETAEARAKNAHRFLDQAEEDLDKMKVGRLNEAVARALAHAHRLADRQKQIRAATDALDKADETVKRAKEKGDRTAAAQEQLLRERQKGLADAQKTLSEQADSFKKYVERVHDAAKEGKEDAVAKMLEEGVNAMNRDDRELTQRMVDAYVEINKGKFKDAKKPQDDASDTVKTVVEALGKASDALSGTKEGALARAAKRAKEVKEKGLELAGMDEKDIPGAEKKDDEKKPGEEKKPGDDDKKDDGKKDAKKDGKDDDKKTAKKDDAKAGTDDKKKGDDAELSRQRRREEASRLWGEVRTLADELDRTDAVPKAARERLKGTGEADFGRMFEERDADRMKEFLALVTRVSALLDEKLAEAQTAKKLESGLRDECPPAYRRLVGKYYSVLSSGK